MAEKNFHGTSADYIRSGASLLPPEFTHWIDESMAWKRSCYIGDWSFLMKILLEGPDALRLLSDLSVNSMAKFDIGQAKHCIQCAPGGQVIAEGIAMRVAEQSFLYQGGPMLHWLPYKCREGGYQATTQIIGGFNFQVSGPNALFVLEKVTGEELRDIGFMRFRETRIGGTRFVALRQGMAGEIGYELQGASDDKMPVYNAILQAGEEFGIRRLGLRTFSINHLEACFPTYGVDYKSPAFSRTTPELAGFRDYLREVAPDSFNSHIVTKGSFQADDLIAWCRTPVELGWQKNIKFDHEFVGRTALEKELAKPRRKMVTLVWNQDDVVDVYASLFRDEEPFEYMELPRNLQGVMWTDRVTRNGVDVGASTSRGYSYHLRKMISLCTIDVDLSKPGEAVTVLWGPPGHPQKSVRATVAPAPIKQDNRRIDVAQLPRWTEARTALKLGPAQSLRIADQR